MKNQIKDEIVKILKEAIDELEKSNGSITSGVQKLLRASKLSNNENVEKWCLIQLGEDRFTLLIKEYLNKVIEYSKSKTDKSKNAMEEKKQKLIEKGLIEGFHFPLEELKIKANESSGGFKGIGFVEEKYKTLAKEKKGNDNTYYKTNLLDNLDYVKKNAHHLAIQLHKQLAYADTPQTVLDFLRQEVDNKLLNLNPELAENLMLAFKTVSSNNKEEWSQALVTSRRLIESFADIVYPPRDEVNGRKMGQENYINRIWGFMDERIESESEKKLAKAHIDFLGNYLQNVHKITNKGVHTELSKIEAIKTIIHLYLIFADLLKYLVKDEKKSEKKISIYKATLDEIESLANINRNIAKDIIKLRVAKENITKKDLLEIKGIGDKTARLIEEIFDL